MLNVTEPTPHILNWTNIDTSMQITQYLDNVIYYKSTIPSHELIFSSTTMSAPHKMTTWVHYTQLSWIGQLVLDYNNLLSGFHNSTNTDSISHTTASCRHMSPCLCNRFGPHLRSLFGGPFSTSQLLTLGLYDSGHLCFLLLRWTCCYEYRTHPSIRFIRTIYSIKISTIYKLLIFYFYQ